jgi:hypothetical protein
MKKASAINHDRPLVTFHASGRISIYTPLGLDFHDHFNLDPSTCSAAFYEDKTVFSNGFR